ncbi:hypothetical protein AB4Z40_34960 [Bosea sp. 2YAB26]|uniref:hypothetical protein n=1 Tax=Bosea sp. 2YAB26 TaxID=3237478 RepID=UPI003F8E7544
MHDFEALILDEPWISEELPYIGTRRASAFYTGGGIAMSAIGGYHHSGELVCLDADASDAVIGRAAIDRLKAFSPIYQFSPGKRLPYDWWVENGDEKPLAEVQIRDDETLVYIETLFDVVDGEPIMARAEVSKYSFAAKLGSRIRKLLIARHRFQSLEQAVKSGR